MNIEKEISLLLKVTSKKHHNKYKKTNGKDTKWSTWYAEYLLEKTDFTSILGHNYTVKSLSLLLFKISLANPTKKSNSNWSNSYAKLILKATN